MKTFWLAMSLNLQSLCQRAALAAVQRYRTETAVAGAAEVEAVAATTAAEDIKAQAAEAQAALEAVEAKRAQLEAEAAAAAEAAQKKQAQEAACHLRVDVSCRLVGKQQFGLSNNRARNGSTLFFTA